MLSRIAESLFWIGRYVERAEDTARILDVHVHHLLETQVESEAELCARLLAVMGVKALEVDSELLTSQQVVDQTRPASPRLQSWVKGLSVAGWLRYPDGCLTLLR